MEMRTRSFNMKDELAEYINTHNIKKEDIVAVFQDAERMFVLWYYVHE